jgi:hypothetical protein
MLCRRHPWSTYAVFLTTITSWSLIYDLGLAWLWWLVTSEWEQQPRLVARTGMYLWIFILCRLIKYVEHFVRYPSDLVYVPLVPLFGYFHSVCIKLYAAFTLNVVSTNRPLPPQQMHTHIGARKYASCQTMPLFLWRGKSSLARSVVLWCVIDIACGLWW